MDISAALLAVISHNGWHVIDDDVPMKMDNTIADDDLSAVAHVLTVQRGDALPTRIVIGKPTRGLNLLAAEVRDQLGSVEGANLLIACPVELPAHRRWIQEYQINFALRYARGEGETEEAFWGRVLPWASPVCGYLPMPQFLPAQDPSDRVVLLTGWNKSTLCRGLGGTGIDVVDGVVDGLHMSVAARKLREIAHQYACTGLPLVLSIRDETQCRYTARLFRAQGVKVGMYTVAPTESGIEASRS